MRLPDVNILIYAHREDAVHHELSRAWLEAAMAGTETLGVSDTVLSGFVRVVTHPRVFQTPSPLDLALDFVERLRSSPTTVRVSPGERHWSIFTELCRRANAKGNLVPDAWLAALAIEAGGEWITTDREFARFPGLRWKSLLQ